ncbi:MAG: anhydro-N-acetylmuramic acid kinase [Alphaproteobacteria bacterium]
MEAFAPVWALGLMSGTSMDGIDVALIETDGERVFGGGPACTVPYAPDLEQSIRAALGKPDHGPALDRDITDAHAEAVQAILSQYPEYKEKTTLVGLHGHTVLHLPGDGITVQVGDGARLAKLTGFDVVYDFRAADVSAGGQGAPFAPLYHQALSRELDGPLAIVNIGGISNVTWIDPAGEAPPVAFDTGPGNALLDDWVRSTTKHPFDRDGTVSAAGKVDSTTLGKLLDNPYFGAPPPKSLDRLDFDAGIVAGLSPGDGAATLVRFTCDTILSGLAHLPAAPRRLLITGGGRRNPTMMKMLAEISDLPVDPVEAVGWDGDAIEAQAFAFLAVRSLRGLPLSLPSTTGVPTPMTGGKLARAA